MDHPYQNLDKSAYWKTGVSELSPLEFSGIFKPKFEISLETKIAAAGSCFAQHIGRQFKDRGFRYLDNELAPPMMNPVDYGRFGFDIYSARYGNVYSIRQMLQLVLRSRGEFFPEERGWYDDGRWFDPFRPAIQPGGFASEAELEGDVSYHLSRVLDLLNEADLMVFTFGLTEGWVNRTDGAALPTCPGTVAGTYDEGKYGFHNSTFAEVMADAESFIAICREHNPHMRFLFTVSPVPLTATATGKHVLPASVYSKSVLRAVCGELEQKYSFVEYFPSYELVAAHPMRAMFFHPNLRAVSSVGVGHVMGVFFSALGRQGKASRVGKHDSLSDADLVCEEEALEANAQ